VDELTDDLAMRRENTNALPHHPVFDGLEPSQLEILMNEEMVERGFEGLVSLLASRC